MIRFFDIVFSLLGILLLSPVFLLLYIAICLESKGGGFYKQLRVGRYGGDFYVYKFRSMRVGADKKGLITVGGRDPRITRTGYLIRKYKLDELPELWNVLIGDMSFVGPRPVLPGIPYAEYDDVRRKRLTVRPGITGYSQAYFRNSVGQEEKFLQDCYYTDHVSLLFDLKILFHTAYSVLKRENVFVKDKKAE